jgi:PAS domain-containing protein
MKVSQQLLLLILTTIIAISAIFYYFGKNRQEEFFQEFLKEHTSMTLKYLSLRVDNALKNDTLDQNEKDKILDILRNDQHIILFQVYNLNNKDLIFSEQFTDVLDISNLTLTDKTSKAKDKCLYDQYIFMSEDIKVKSKDLRFFIAISNEFIKKEEAEQLHGLLLRTLIIFFGASFIAFLFISNINKPLKKLTETAKEIIIGNRNTKADESRGGREVRELAKTLNTMISTINDDQRAIEDNNKVLLEANVKLQKEIAERKKVEESLERSGDNLKKIFNSIPFPLVIIDPDDAKVLLCNSKFRPIFRGVESGDIFIKDHFVDKQDAENLLSALSSGDFKNDWETKLKDKNGREFHTIISSAAINFHDKDAALLAIMDIDDRKLQQQAFQRVIEGTSYTKGEEFLRSLVKNLAMVMKVKYAGVMEIVKEKKDTARALAYWWDDHFVEPFEYNIKGTPCEKVVKGEMLQYTDDLKRFIPGYLRNTEQ